ncbi:MAG: cytochrome B [Actinobacteria bacterium]|nr:cytochrome B [Actinomycetota bacterium]
MAHLAHYRESHPLPFVITHWTNLISMIVLILSGFYIHFPAFSNFMGIARGAHMFFAFLIIINCIVRVILAFVLESAPTGGTRKVEKDYKAWLPQKQNRHQLIPWIKYYLFIKKEHPLGGKYGNPQKLSYLLIPILILFMGYTGFCLWEPTSTIGFFAAGTELMGGLMAMRIIHYFMMWVFICFTMIHAYLANIEGFAPSKMIFAWKEHGGLVYDPDKGCIVGEDNLGQEKH